MKFMEKVLNSGVVEVVLFLISIGCWYLFLFGVCNLKKLD